MRVSIGPVEYLLIEFPGNKFTGEIVPALGRLIENGTVRIIDLVFIRKDDDGTTTTLEFDQLDELAPFAALDGEAGGLLNKQDIAYAGAGLQASSSAALLVWEDTWATELAQAIRNAHGVIIEGARIPHELAEQALSELAVAGAHTS
jgi:Family of unknown function (DUF6325)